MQKIKLNYDHVEVGGIKFANLNKQETLENYKKEIEKGDYATLPVVVRQIVYVDDKEFKRISVSLLTSMDDVWERIGGHSLSEKIMKEYGIEEIDLHNLTEEIVNVVRKHGRAETSKVVNTDTGEIFYVNTEGYSYARYVGIV